MITSSHFFNKSIFHAHDDQIESLANEVGPWFISKSRKYATLDPEKRINNKSQARYKNSSQNEAQIRHSVKAETKLSTLPINLELDSNSNRSLTQQKSLKKPQKVKNQSLLLPQIQNIRKRNTKNNEIINILKDCSPLAYQLNFITKKKQKKVKKPNYLSESLQSPSDSNYQSIQKFLNFQNQSKYNIYEKCVVQVKKRQMSKSKQLNQIQIKN